MNNSSSDADVKGISKQAMKAFMDYFWPGNIRELANAVEHAFVLCSGRQIEVNDLPIEIRNYPYTGKDLDPNLKNQSHSPAGDTGKLTRSTLVTLLEESDWNKAEVARQIGMSRASVWKYMKKWDIPMQP